MMIQAGVLRPFSAATKAPAIAATTAIANPQSIQFMESMATATFQSAILPEKVLNFINPCHAKSMGGSCFFRRASVARRTPREGGPHRPFLFFFRSRFSLASSSSSTNASR